MRAHTTRLARGMAIVAIVPLLMLLNSCSAVPEQTNSGADELSLLYMVDSERATLTASNDMEFRVVLQDTDPTTTWFTDRPERGAGKVRTERLIQSWDALGFAEVPPNIAFTFERDGVLRSAVATMQNPTFDGETATLTATFRALNESDQTGASPTPESEHPTDSLAELPESLENVSIFIDNSQANSALVCELFERYFGTSCPTQPVNPRPRTGGWKPSVI